MKNIDVEILLETLQTEKNIILPVQGVSMVPFLMPGTDSVMVELPKIPPKKGDIVLYKKANSVVMHRVIEVKKTTFSAAGDNERAVESGIPFTYLKARVVQVISPTDRLTCKSLKWKFFAGVFTSEKFRNSSLLRRKP